MLQISVAFLFILAQICANIKGEKCSFLGKYLYDDLNCTPAPRRGGGCPAEYTCPNFNSTMGACKFGSHQLWLGEHIPHLQNAPCLAECVCSTRQNNNDIFNTFEPTAVAKFDCPSASYCSTEIHIIPGQGCYAAHTPGKCCTSTICPTRRDVRAMQKCRVDGNVYLEGEKFYPANTCLECVCQRGFRNKLEPPFCHRKFCNYVQVFEPHYLSRNCAPAFKNHQIDCCPDTWICQGAEPVVVFQVSQSNNYDVQCKFGDKTLLQGQGFHAKNRLLRTKFLCECVIPPFVTCKYQYVHT